MTCNCGRVELAPSESQRVFEHPKYPANIVHRSAICYLVGPRGFPASMVLVEVLSGKST